MQKACAAYLFSQRC